MSTKYSYKGWIFICPEIIVDISKFIQAFTIFWFEDIIDLERISPEIYIDDVICFERVKYSTTETN